MKVHAALALFLFAIALGACASVLGIRARSPSHSFEHAAHVTRGIACTECHAGIATQEKSNGIHVPATAECTKCHKKPHDTRECGICHGEPAVQQEAELVNAQLRFDHARHMPAVKGDCARCHTEAGTVGVRSLEPKMAECFGCHQHQEEWTTRRCHGCHVDVALEADPPESHVVHDGDWIREHGVRAAASRDLCSSCHTERSCAACHGVTVAALPWKLGVGDGQKTGLHLSGFLSRHSDEARAQPALCSSCHTDDFCVSCHAKEHVVAGAGNRDPHPVGWVTGAGGGQHGLEARADPMSCAGCHGGGGEQLCVGCHKVGGAGGSPHGPGFSSNKNKTHDMPCRLCHAGGT